MPTPTSITDQDPGRAAYEGALTGWMQSIQSAGNELGEKQVEVTKPKEPEPKAVEEPKKEAEVKPDPSKTTAKTATTGPDPAKPSSPDDKSPAPSATDKAEPAKAEDKPSIQPILSKLAEGKELTAEEISSLLKAKAMPKKHADWTKLLGDHQRELTGVTKTLKEIQAERDKLKSEVEKAKTAGPPPELETTRKEMEELRAIVRGKAVEELPEFKRYFDQKINSELSDVKSSMPGEVGEKIGKLLLEPESEWKTQQIAELTVELNEDQQFDVRQARKNLRRIQNERKQAIDEERTKGTEREALTAKKREEEALAQRRNAETLISDTLNVLKGTDEFKDVLNDDHGKLVRAIALGETAEPKMTLALLARGAVFEDVRKTWTAEKVELSAKVAELEEQLKSLQTSEPKQSTSTASSGDSEVDEEIKSGMRPMDVGAIMTRKLWKSAANR